MTRTGTWMGTKPKQAPNHSRRHIAALWREGMKPKGRRWAARGARERWSSRFGLTYSGLLISASWKRRCLASPDH